MFPGLRLGWYKRIAGSEARENLLRMTLVNMSGEGSNGTLLEALKKLLVSVKPGTLGLSIAVIQRLKLTARVFRSLLYLEEMAKGFLASWLFIQLSYQIPSPCHTS